MCNNETSRWLTTDEVAKSENNYFGVGTAPKRTRRHGRYMHPYSVGKVYLIHAPLVSITAVREIDRTR